MLFGTKERMVEIPTPLATAEYANIGWSDSDTLLNGGGWARSSFTNHKEVSLSWGMQLREDTQVIKDFADGLYGEGPFFMVDPMAEKLNLLPAWWAAPMLGTLDAPSLLPGIIPEKVATPTNKNNFPIYSAKYTFPAANLALPLPESIVIPIPPDKCMSLGVHGSATGSGVVLAQGIMADGRAGAMYRLDLIDVTSPVMTNLTFLGGDFIAVRMFLRRDDDGPATLTLSGLVARVSDHIFPSMFTNLEYLEVGDSDTAPSRPKVERSAYPFILDGTIYTDEPESLDNDDTIEPAWPASTSDADALAVEVSEGVLGSPAYLNPTGFGKFIGGRGNSGLSFVDAPLEAPVSGRPEMSTIAAKFTETGGWDGPADYFPWGPVRYDNGADGVEYFDNIARIAMSEDRFAL